MSVSGGESYFLTTDVERRMVKGMAKGGCQKLNVPYVFFPFSEKSRMVQAVSAAAHSTPQQRPAVNNNLRPYILQ